MKVKFATNAQRLSAKGFTLIELMIALVLGLLIIAGVIGVFVSNKQAYRQNENLARMQESARYAFEVVARDIRDAGGIGCGSNLPTANVVNNPSTQWWSDWGDGIRGYGGAQAFPAKAIGTNTTDRVAGTDAVIVWSGNSNADVTIVSHNPNSAQFKVNTTAHAFSDGNVLMVCDFKQAAIFQVTNANSANVTIVHGTGNTVTPGNCSKGLGYPSDCSSVNGNPYTFAGGGVLTKLSSNAWYIGFNGRGSKSLYRVSISGTDEVAEGVSDMQLQYLVRDVSANLASDYVDATAITDWTLVVAARVVFNIDTLESVGTDGNMITRTWNTAVMLRNRELPE